MDVWGEAVRGGRGGGGIDFLNESFNISKGARNSARRNGSEESLQKGGSN